MFEVILNRVIAVPEGFTLYRLAEAIVDSFGFYFDHPFGFYDNIRQWTKSKEGYELFVDIGEESEFKGVERTKVGKVFDEINKKMLFLFDYGDEWHFIVALIRNRITQGEWKISIGCGICWGCSSSIWRTR